MLASKNGWDTSKQRKLHWAQEQNSKHFSTHLRKKIQPTNKQQPTDHTAMACHRGHKVATFKRITYLYIKREYREFSYEILGVSIRNIEKTIVECDRAVQPLLHQSLWWILAREAQTQHQFPRSRWSQCQPCSDGLTARSRIRALKVLGEKHQPRQPAAGLYSPRVPKEK